MQKKLYLKSDLNETTYNRAANCGTDFATLKTNVFFYWSGTGTPKEGKEPLIEMLVLTFITKIFQESEV